MSEYLKISQLTESRAFIRSFVKEIEVRPGKATIHYSISTPEDSPIGEADLAQIALGKGVRSMGVSGGAKGTKTLDRYNAGVARSHLSDSPNIGQLCIPQPRPL